MARRGKTGKLLFDEYSFRFAKWQEGGTGSA
jgi:hypothetical protein